MTEQMIKPEDVRVGDRIRIEWMRGDLLTAETGTVAIIDTEGYRMSPSRWFIGPSFIKERVNKGERITITLLSRPKPKLPTKVGSVIHVSEWRGIKCDTLAILDCDMVWYTPIPQLDESQYHSPRDITVWEPRDVVEVEK